jgi:peptide deformylase
MAVRPILKMGDPRLLQPAEPVRDFASPELKTLIEDMFDTMASAGGVGLAAPQIGVGLQVVIFGFERSERYPDAEPVPTTILVNPVIAPMGDEEEEDWEGCLSVPGLRGMGAALQAHPISGVRREGAAPSTAPWKASIRGWCSTNATT